MKNFFKKIWNWLRGKTEVDDKIVKKYNDVKETIDELKKEVKDVSEEVKDVIDVVKKKKNKK
jgi:site-specific DNA-adenine methylase